jgi:spore protease
MEPMPWQVRTDLAVEAVSQHGEEALRRHGVQVEREPREPDLTVERVWVQDEAGAERIGKPPGRYVTVRAPRLRERSRAYARHVVAAVAQELGALLRLEPDTSVLLVGLGNWKATPDALGPRVTERVLVTRHLGEAVPQELKGRLRPVAAVAPGVLGLTGMETGEIVRGVVREVKPQRVVCVDALAAQDPSRLLTTVQISDTGIQPGSGVGNRRAALTQQTLGVPTLAMGVPTVVHALAIVEASLRLLQPGMGRRRGGADMEGEGVREALWPVLGTLVVTPKEIDALLEEAAWVVAGSLNAALHPGVDLSDFADYAGA